MEQPLTYRPMHILIVRPLRAQGATKLPPITFPSFPIAHRIHVRRPCNECNPIRPQIRPSYRLNFGPTGGSPFFAFLFDDTQDPNDPDPIDLRGEKRTPRRFVDWQTFFNFGDGNFRANKKIDGKLSSVLMLLPGSRGPAPGLRADGVQSLASRNLMRPAISGYRPARRLRGGWVPNPDVSPTRGLRSQRVSTRDAGAGAGD